MCLCPDAVPRELRPGVSGVQAQGHKRIQIVRMNYMYDIDVVAVDLILVVS